METQSLSPKTSPPHLSTPENDEKKQRRAMIATSIVVGIVVLLFITFFVLLLLPGVFKVDTVSRIRDVFIIVMALESLLIGAVLIILIVQVARLTNLMQNEIKPIMESTNETMNTLRGTTTFLSNNLVEPVIKLNEYTAAIQRLLEILGFIRPKV